MKLQLQSILHGKRTSTAPDDDAFPSFSMNRSEMTPTRFVELMNQHKALIISAASDEGEEPLTVEDLGSFLVDLQLEHYPYIGGAAPRTVIPVTAGKDIIFTANERCVYRSSGVSYGCVKLID
jgi:hypothetical protein